MIKQTTTLFVLSLLFYACGGLDISLLAGQWQAVQLIEDDKILDLDLSTTKFSFNDHGGYTYETNVNYKEAGTYFLDSKQLITKDTLDEHAIKKSVLINFLSPDSMTLKMNAKGKIQLLSLKKMR